MEELAEGESGQGRIWARTALGEGCAETADQSVGTKLGKRDFQMTKKALAADLTERRVTHAIVVGGAATEWRKGGPAEVVVSFEAEFKIQAEMNYE